MGLRDRYRVLKGGGFMGVRYPLGNLREAQKALGSSGED